MKLIMYSTDYGLAMYQEKDGEVTPYDFFKYGNELGGLIERVVPKFNEVDWRASEELSEEQYEKDFC